MCSLQVEKRWISWGLYKTGSLGGVAQCAHSTTCRHSRQGLHGSEPGLGHRSQRPRPEQWPEAPSADHAAEKLCPHGVVTGSVKDRHTDWELRETLLTERGAHSPVGIAAR
uniref:Uncharacterized protein n=1 Tax=Knipowitschia caucasica TaxID=637954 RepID=A0AAV2LZR7_KNICA